jgi:hypothetical protein
MFNIIKNIQAADIPSMEQQLTDASTATGLANADFATVVGTLLNGLLGILGTAFLLLTIYAGFLWMTAAGNEEKITKAQGIIRTSVIGLLIVVLSYAITKFVFNTLIEAGL